MNREQVDFFIEEGVCIKCHGDDIECLEDCTKHVCVDCGTTQEDGYPNSQGATNV